MSRDDSCPTDLETSPRWLFQDPRDRNREKAPMSDHRRDRSASRIFRSRVLRHLHPSKILCKKVGYLSVGGGGEKIERRNRWLKDQQEWSSVDLDCKLLPSFRTFLPQTTYLMCELRVVVEGEKGCLQFHRNPRLQATQFDRHERR